MIKNTDSKSFLQDYHSVFIFLLKMVNWSFKVFRICISHYINAISYYLRISKLGGKLWKY